MCQDRVGHTSWRTQDDGQRPRHSRGGDDRLRDLMFHNRRADSMLIPDVRRPQFAPDRHPHLNVLYIGVVYGPVTPGLISSRGRNAVTP